MEFALSAMIEQAECCIAALLNLCDDKSRADCVDGPGGDENAVALRDRLPHNKILDRSVLPGLAQLLRRQTPFQAQDPLCFRRTPNHIPTLVLPVLPSYPLPRPLSR